MPVENLDRVLREELQRVESYDFTWAASAPVEYQALTAPEQQQQQLVAVPTPAITGPIQQQAPQQQQQQLVAVPTPAITTQLQQQAPQGQARSRQWYNNTPNRRRTTYNRAPQPAFLSQTYYGVPRPPPPPPSPYF